MPYWEHQTDLEKRNLPHATCTQCELDIFNDIYHEGCPFEENCAEFHKKKEMYEAAIKRGDAAEIVSGRVEYCNGEWDMFLVARMGKFDAFHEYIGGIESYIGVHREPTEFGRPIPHDKGHGGAGRFVRFSNKILEDFWRYRRVTKKMRAHFLTVKPDDIVDGVVYWSVF